MGQLPISPSPMLQKMFKNKTIVARLIINSTLVQGEQMPHSNISMVLYIKGNGSFFLLRLLCIFINLPYGHAWNTVFMPGLVLLVATWNC